MDTCSIGIPKYLALGHTERTLKELEGAECVNEIGSQGFTRVHSTTKTKRKDAAARHGSFRDLRFATRGYQPPSRMLKALAPYIVSVYISVDLL